MNNKTGGSAFPALNYIVPNNLSKEGVRRLGETQGMTLRDYFAAKAMAAIWSNQYVIEGLSHITEDQAKTISKMAFEQADSMLAEREK